MSSDITIKTLRSYVNDLEKQVKVLEGRTPIQSGSALKLLLEGLETENARLKAELEKERAARHNTVQINQDLRAELEALRPKPVVNTATVLVSYCPQMDGCAGYTVDLAVFGESKNLKLTFHDGILTKAEVIG